MTQRATITRPTTDYPTDYHSVHEDVLEATMVGTNVVRLKHMDGDVTMVVLGEGYTIVFEEM